VGLAFAGEAGYRAIVHDCLAIVTCNISGVNYARSADEEITY